MSGVVKYTRATVELFFEHEHCDCAHCPLLETYARKQCRRTGEYIIEDRIRGYYCPLNIEEESEEDEFV